MHEAGLAPGRRVPEPAPQARIEIPRSALHSGGQRRLRQQDARGGGGHSRPPVGAIAPVPEELRQWATLWSLRSRRGVGSRIPECQPLPSPNASRSSSRPVSCAGSSSGSSAPATAPAAPRSRPRLRVARRGRIVPQEPARQTQPGCTRTPHVGPRCARRQPTHAGTSTPPRAHRVGLDPPWPRPSPRSRIDARPSKTHRTLVEAALQAPLPRPTVASLNLQRAPTATGNPPALCSASHQGRAENSPATLAITPPHATAQSRAHPPPPSPRAHP